MDILIIIAKSTAILTLFYVLYQAALQKDTFYAANRHYLLAGIIAALIIPWIEFSKTVYIDIPAISNTPIITGDFTPMYIENLPQEAAFRIDWWLVALTIYSAGVFVMLGRFLVQLHSLKKLLNKYPGKAFGSFTYIQIDENVAPFSFFRNICFNPALHTEEELAMIIAHEKVHARQLHTLDMLLTQIILALQWINPIAWLYKKSLEQNLEFLADAAALNTIDSSKAYQYTLVKVSSTAFRPALTNQFYHSLIKKRIVMLNKETSRRRNLLKLGLVLPVLGVFMYSFNVKEVIEYREAAVDNIAFAKSLAAEATADSKMPSQEFTIDAHSDKAYLKSIEAYFKNTFASTEVRFTALKYKDEQLIGFDFETKMKGESRFITQYSTKSGVMGITPFKITPIKEHEILQRFTDGHDILFTPEGSHTTITVPDNEDIIGKDPIIVLNGSVIEDNSDKTSYTASAGVKMVNPKEAVALYGKAASGGAIVIEDPTASSKQLNNKAFVINHTTTEAQINAIEDYFRENHPDALIQIYDVKRDLNGEIQSYRVRTKFDSTSEWQNILEVNNKNSVAQGLQIRYLSGEIQLIELGSKGIEMRSSNKGLFVDNKTLGKGLTGFVEGMEALVKSNNNDVLLHFTKNTTDTELDLSLIHI